MVVFCGSLQCCNHHVYMQSVCSSALPHATLTTCAGMIQRSIREQPTSSSMHSDEEGNAASVEVCTHPKVLHAQAQNRRQETSDVQHSSPCTTDPSTLAKPPKVGRQCRRMKGHSSLCGSLKSAPHSSKSGQTHFKEQGRDLPCSNPWLPNGQLLAAPVSLGKRDAPLQCFQCVTASDF